jgi:hypothetical protein
MEEIYTVFSCSAARSWMRACVRPMRAPRARRLAIDNIRSAVFSQTLRIMKDNFAAIGNFL